MGHNGELTLDITDQHIQHLQPTFIDLNLQE